ncbi:MAG: hypothetical protein LAP21_15140 [Acidobacteriia bacterium]|nr:hypothetical protein [Terriglobia bacterium]
MGISKPCSKYAERGEENKQILNRTFHDVLLASGCWLEVSRCGGGTKSASDLGKKIDSIRSSFFSVSFLNWRNTPNQKANVQASESSVMIKVAICIH